MLKTLKNLPIRIKKASYYSWCGLYSAAKKEESIRLEFLSLIILSFILFFCPWPNWKKMTMIGTFLLIPLTELLNSAVEDICDLVSPDYHPKVKDAKDKGSAAVLLAIIINILILVALIKI